MSLSKLLPFLFLFVLLGTLLIPAQASAIANDYLIDDTVFMDSNSMGAGDIWNFLNQKGSGLAGINVVETEPSYPNYNRTVNVAQAIFDAGQVYGMSPRVILATLQKEQSLITDPTPDSSQLRSAMGYGCPDSAACDDAYAGLFYQIDNGTWQLRLNRERAIGNNSWWNPAINYACPGTTRYYTPGLYPGNYVAFKDDGGVTYTGFVIATAATASLYCYTPHAYNNPTGAYGNPQWGTTGQYYSGSYNFLKNFEMWWGSTRANAYSYSFYSASNSSATLQMGQKQSNTVILYNNGRENWYADGNVPAGKHPTRLAMNGYKNTVYADTSDPVWMGTRNQVKMNQPVVAPGQYASFTISLVGPSSSIAPPELLNFVPVVDGVGFMPNINMLMWAATVPPPYSVVSASGLPSQLLPNEQSTASIVLKNNSVSTWYADGSVPVGQHPTRLAMKNYAETGYADRTDPAWLGTRNQIKMTPATVAPGQNATFTFKLEGPYVKHSEKLHFVPVLDGVTFMNDINMYTFTSTPTPVNSYVVDSVTKNPPNTMTAGTTANGVSVVLRNLGNTVWRSDTSKQGAYTTRLVMANPAYRNSPFYNSADTSWITASQIKMSSPTVRPGEWALFTFTWKAPTTPGLYKESFRPVIDGYTLLNDVGMRFDTTVTP